MKTPLLYRYPVSVPLFIIALMAVSYVTGNVFTARSPEAISPKARSIPEGERKRFSLEESAQPIVFKKFDHNQIRCASSKPFKEGDILKNDKDVHFFVYEYMGDEPPFNGDFTFSSSMLEKNPYLSLRDTLRTITKEKVYYIRSDKELVFDCNTGTLEEATVSEPEFDEDFFDDFFDNQQPPAADNCDKCEQCGGETLENCSEEECLGLGPCAFTSIAPFGGICDPDPAECGEITIPPEEIIEFEPSAEDIEDMFELPSPSPLSNGCPPPPPCPMPEIGPGCTLKPPTKDANGCVTGCEKVECEPPVTVPSNCDKCEQCGGGEFEKCKEEECLGLGPCEFTGIASFGGFCEPDPIKCAVPVPAPSPSPSPTPTPTPVPNPTPTTGNICYIDMCPPNSEIRCDVPPIAIDCSSPDCVNNPKCKPAANQSCTPKTCSDGKTFPTCDANGNPINYFADPCLTSATPICGDGKIQLQEKCDDQNEISYDGCSKTCKVEMGWKCEGSPSKCKMLVPDENAS